MEIGARELLRLNLLRAPNGMRCHRRVNEPLTTQQIAATDSTALPEVSRVTFAQCGHSMLATACNCDELRRCAVELTRTPLSRN